MLNKIHRLTKGVEFQDILRNGSKAYGMMVVIRYKKHDENKIGFIVSTKVAKNATDRNRIKRLLREVVRREFLEKMKGYWVVMVAKKDIVDKDYAQIKHDLQISFKKRGLI